MITALLQTTDNKIAIGTSHGAAILDADGWQSIKSEKGKIPNVITAGVAGLYGDIWFGTQHSGVLHIDTNMIDIYDTTVGLKSNNISALAINSDILAVGTTGGGLTLHRKGKWKTLRTSDGLLNEFITALYIDKKGYLWVGYHLDGVTKLFYDTTTAAW